MPARLLAFKKPGCDICGQRLMGSPHHSLEMDQRAGRNPERTQEQISWIFKRNVKMEQESESWEIQTGWVWGLLAVCSPRNRPPPSFSQGSRRHENPRKGLVTAPMWNSAGDPSRGVGKQHGSRRLLLALSLWDFRCFHNIPAEVAQRVRGSEEGLRTRKAERGVDLIAQALDCPWPEHYGILGACRWPRFCLGRRCSQQQSVFLLGTEWTLTGKALDSEQNGRKFQAQQTQLWDKWELVQREKGVTSLHRGSTVCRFQPAAVASDKGKGAVNPRC